MVFRDIIIIIKELGDRNKKRVREPLRTNTGRRRFLTECKTVWIGS